MTVSPEEYRANLEAQAQADSQQKMMERQRMEASKLRDQEYWRPDQTVMGGLGAGGVGGALMTANTAMNNAKGYGDTKRLDKSIAAADQRGLAAGVDQQMIDYEGTLKDRADKDRGFAENQRQFKLTQQHQQQMLQLQQQEAQRKQESSQAHTDSRDIRAQDKPDNDQSNFMDRTTGKKRKLLGTRRGGKKVYLDEQGNEVDMSNYMYDHTEDAATGRALGPAESTAITDRGAQINSLSKHLPKWKDAYAQPTGVATRLFNKAGAWLSANDITKLANEEKDAELREALHWWAEWRSLSTIPERNNIFGATLTPGEDNAWSESELMELGQNPEDTRKRMMDIFNRMSHEYNLGLDVKSQLYSAFPTNVAALEMARTMVPGIDDPTHPENAGYIGGPTGSVYRDGHNRPYVNGVAVDTKVWDGMAPEFQNALRLANPEDIPAMVKEYTNARKTK